MDRENVITKIQLHLQKIAAAEAAELFISPFIDKELFLKSTAEEGPSIWIVNRSDVYDETLKILGEHSIPGIAKRALEKLSQRKSELKLHLPPPPHTDLETAEEYEIENILGHPQASFESILYFTHHSKEDFRASSALSLIRRCLEYPPDWSLHQSEKLKIIDTFFKVLTTDISAMVRAYAARIPLFSEEQIVEAYQNEKHPLVKGRLLQNPALSSKFYSTLSNEDLRLKDSFYQQVLSLDKRLPMNLRKDLMNLNSDPLSQLFHEWHFVS